ncbi:S1C family serine protease [uncultured Micrococcus sp.]|uniref:S1C family serine protease n=1 Tax=uncultured Micrococcus sp. TaxID=114051 RepID=UPI0025F7ECD6|nr:trypsin-like peptidase domain-containing protein [uncultured Micrococcus sp.]
MQHTTPSGVGRLAHASRLRPRSAGGALVAAVLALSLAGCGAAAPGPDAAAAASGAPTTSPDGQGPGSAAATVGSQPVSDNAVGQAAATALPSVVTISATSGQGSGSGSGSIIDDRGHILTNTHVVTLGGATADADITVRTADGEVYAATVVGTDPVSDLAVIKVDAQGLTPIALGSSADLRVGDDAIAIGAPLGLPNTVTDGIVSTLDRTIAVASAAAPEEAEASAAPDGERFRFEVPGAPAPTPQQDIYINVLQTDAAINPGNSGGALVNSRGELVGVNVAIASAGGQESGNIGVGFAIPVDYARRVAEDLIREGSASHGLLGVAVTPQPADVQGGDEAARTVFSDGARVETVTEGSPAAAAGLQEGDVITAVSDRTVSDTQSLTAVVREHRAQDTVTVHYTRDGQEATADVTLGAMESGR